jgi:hypothetical protein
MKPMGDFLQQLFPSVPTEKVKTLSVDHVIPDSNILPLTVPIRVCVSPHVFVSTSVRHYCNNPHTEVFPCLAYARVILF